MNKILTFILSAVILLSLVACGMDSGNAPEAVGVTVTDAFGNSTVLWDGARVVSCNGSFSDCWLLSGGILAGVAEDAVEQGVVAEGTLPIVGTVKQIDLEKVISLNPDYVILSADLAEHLKLQDVLTAAGISHGYFRVDTFADYKAMMAQFCAVNGRDDLYQTNVVDVETRINAIMEKIPKESDIDFLLMRVYSTGMKAKREDNLAGQILAEFALCNIADRDVALLEELSVEKVVLSDPDHIFALAMGSEEAAAEYLRLNVENNPAWSGLSAVKNGNYHLLPKTLFHYKPNERWDESYEYLAKIIYPEIFG